MSIPSDKLAWTDYTYVEFIGGPLDGQLRKMEVYVSVIPLTQRSYYQNVNAVETDEYLNPRSKVRYKFFIDGVETI